ncbi:MFS transporter [Enterococcus hermanniensis]|uniref:Major facilitator superfamily transporter n=1 Tax=Enterococcus hermanniensis TaxID=249189 RepID=A0A1L8TML3_9ENTE|nr:MFS transporter [Enterococcus hermanniensis]OJG45551.1 major facilitator superfamily transporter [Enterococcus hermanniensis]
MTIKEEEKLFNKGFITITIINFIVFLVYYCFVVITAKYATQSLGATTAQAGLAVGIYIIGTLLARLYVGKKLELFGRRAVLRYGALFYLITTAGYLVSTNIFILDSVRFLNGFCYGAVSTAANAIVTAYIPESKYGEGINYYGLSTSLAAAIGPFIGLLLLPILGFKAIIIIAVILAFVTMIACFGFKVENIVLTDEHRARINKFSLESFIELKVLFIAAIAFLIGIAYSSVLGFISIYADELHLVTAGAFFFVVYALVVTVTRPMSGKIFDKYGENAVMYPSFICLTIGLILLAVTQNAPVLLIAGAFVGLGYGTFMANGQAVTLKLVEQERIGVALSTYFIGLDLGLGVGPYLLGAIKGLLGTYQHIYIFCAVIPIIVAVLYMIFYHPNKKLKMNH